MRLSKYNYIFDDKDYSYWFNGLTKKYFRLSQPLSQKMERLTSDLEGLKTTSVSFYAKLVEGGFIVNDEEDELELVKRNNNDIIHNKEYFLIVLPTLNCNFKCWYCIQDHVDTQMSEATIQRVLRHIDYMIDIKDISSLHLEWFGGEPLMYFKQVVDPISKYAISKCTKAGISFQNSATTNGYYLNGDVLTALEDLCFDHFQITLDGVQELHDKVKFQNNCASAFEHVLRNINAALNQTKNLKVFLRINYTHKNLSEEIVNQVNHYIEAANRKRVIILPRKVWQEAPHKGLMAQVMKVLDKFEASGYKVSAFTPFNFFIPCYANKEFYNAISYNGNVVKCTANYDMYNPQPKGVLNENGKIDWKEDFDTKYQSKTYENTACATCKHLPICMGPCPRNYLNGSTACKYEGEDYGIEDLLFDFLKREYHG